MLRGLSASQELSVSVHDLQAPTEDGALLAYPPLEQVGRVLAENQRRQDDWHLDILGRPIQSLRLLAQQPILALAQRYLASEVEPTSISVAKPIFLTGHQPELHHPGVWIKNFALSGLARAHGALALNLVVDNDTAKSTLLHVPAGDHVAQVPFDH